MKRNIGNFANATLRAKIARRDLQSCTGPLFLGIDAGSTTTKAALIDQNEKLVFSFYRNNEGNPLEATKQLLTGALRAITGCVLYRQYNRNRIWGGADQGRL